jgi:MYXO-CTERM domain-containing protein
MQPGAERRLLCLVALLAAACASHEQEADRALGRIASPLGTPTRGDSIPIGIENVNDSPMKDASYRALLRFVPDATVTIDRFYFGFKLRGADCWDAGAAGYGAGDGGTLEASLVDIDPVTGHPTTILATETINGCTRHNEASAEVGGSDPVLVWVNTAATLEQDRMYGLVVRNAHANPAGNFYSFNMPLADTVLAGPHARNELDPRAPGAILSLDPREHVAWSTDGGATWRYGSDNGQYLSYMNNNDHAHPATRMPQYGWRRSDGITVAQQPYYAYSDDCAGCSVTYANARYARTFTAVGGFIASGTNVGTLTFTNTSTGASSSCTPSLGYGFRTCKLSSSMSVAVGQDYRVSSTGSVEIMRLDNPQRVMFPRVGTPTGEHRAFQTTPAPATNAKDVPSLWAGPVSAEFPGAGDVGADDAGIEDATAGEGGATGGSRGTGGAAGTGGAGTGGTGTGGTGTDASSGAGGTGSGGMPGTGDDAGKGGAAGAATSGATGGSGAGSAGAMSVGRSEASSGCNCLTTSGRPPSPRSWLVVLGLVLARTRRRRARRLSFASP